MPCLVHLRVDNEDRIQWGQETESYVIPVRLSLNAILRVQGFWLLFLLPSIWGFHMMLTDLRVLQGQPGVKCPGCWVPIPTSARAVRLLWVFTY